MAERDYHLRLGQVVIGLRCPDTDFAKSMADYFAQTSDPAAPDVNLELNLVPHQEDPRVPNSLILTKTVTADGFDIADGLVRGHFDPVSGQGELHVKTILTNGLMTRVFEQILYQAFHSAVLRTGYDACLIHSAGVVRDGLGYLFVGPSDAGKSTIASLSLDATVLNDEMNLVEFGSDSPRIVTSPFNGHFTDKSPGEAPLTAIILPDKGLEHRIEPVGSGFAAAAIATQVAPPVPLETGATAGTNTAMLDVASRLVGLVPVKRLVFLPDAGFWPVVSHEFTPDQRG